MFWENYIWNDNAEQTPLPYEEVMLLWNGVEWVEEKID